MTFVTQYTYVHACTEQDQSQTFASMVCIHTHTHIHAHIPYTEKGGSQLFAGLVYAGGHEYMSMGRYRAHVRGHTEAPQPCSRGGETSFIHMYNVRVYIYV